MQTVHLFIIIISFGDLQLFMGQSIMCLKLASMLKLYVRIPMEMIILTNFEERKFGMTKHLNSHPTISCVQFNFWKSNTNFEFAFWKITPFTDLDLFTYRTLDLSTSSSVQCIPRIHYKHFQSNIVSEKSFLFVLLRRNGRNKPLKQSRNQTRLNSLKH